MINYFYNKIKEFFASKKQARIKSETIYFDAKTSHVYDDKNNFIGTGEIINGKLRIKSHLII